MKKNLIKLSCLRMVRSKHFKVMKILSLFLFICGLTYATKIEAQKVNVSIKKGVVLDVIEQIEKQCEFRFVYSPKFVDMDKTVSLEMHQTEVTEVLAEVLKETNLTYIIDGNVVVLRPISMTSVFQQDIKRTVSGTVKDYSGEPIPGVTILVKGSSVGTISDVDGKFSLSNVSEDAILVFSFVGMKTQEVLVANKTSLSIVLLDEAIGLEEVIAVGYGTQKKRDLTGAVTSVYASDIEQRSVTNFSNALQGAAAGVTVTRSNSTPGSTSTIRIRGITTLQGSNDPLVLVDDVPTNIDDVNPNDIESYTVLKDAAAAAIYGSRAAAGVILITTKRAKSGDFSLNYDYSISFDKPTDKFEYVDAPTYMRMWNEKVWNDSGNGENEYPTYSKEYIDSYLENHELDPNFYPNTDWTEMQLKDFATHQRHNLVLSGGGEKIKTKVSMNYEDQDALYAIRNWKRYTLRVNNDFKINDKLSASADVSFFYTKNIVPVRNINLRESPLEVAYWTDGRFGSITVGNPLAKLHGAGNADAQTRKFTTRLGLKYEPVNNLILQTNFSPSTNDFYRKQYQPYFAIYEFENPETPVVEVNPTPSLYERRNRSSRYSLQFLANYSAKIGQHTIAPQLGYEEYEGKSENLAVYGLNFDLTGFPYMNFAPVDQFYWDKNNDGVSESAYRSYFGRINYNYANKYLFQVNARYDGSSKFASDYRWGMFPSVSAGWVLSEENFFGGIKNTIDFLKLRASYGVLGNDRLGNYLYSSVLSTGTRILSDANGNPVSTTQAYQANLALKDITWETTETFNIGFDIAAFENRLNTTFEWYNKETYDMLLGLELPPTTGYSSVNSNIGDMNTKGWEVSVGWKDKVGDLTYSASFHIFDSKTIVGDINDKEIQSGNTIIKEGYEYAELYGYIADGIFQTQEEVDEAAETAYISKSTSPGDIRYVDVSGPEAVRDSIINSEDRVHLGSSLPHYNYGGTINLGYKGFDFGIIFQGVGKQNRVLPSSPYNGFSGNGTPTTEYATNNWSAYNTPEENTNALYPRLTSKTSGLNSQFSSYWIVNGAYFRLKNITLGYTLPQSLTRKVNIQKLRFYITGNDLLTFDHFPKGLDPEDTSSYFITKSFIVGANIKF